MKKKTFCFDLDNTLCKTKNSNYSKSKPKKKAIKIVNLLFDKGYNIKIYTARYMGRSNDSLQNKRKIYSKTKDVFNIRNTTVKKILELILSVLK